MKSILAFTAALLTASCQTTDHTEAALDGSFDAPVPEIAGNMDLGNFSVSLAVKDLAKSRAFYEALGFEQIGGEAEQNWLILQNGASTIGLFQNMFEENIMTFNPGWSRSAEALAEFKDIRDIQRHLKKNGISLMAEADESTTGPASFMVQDPDGNTILFDQHVDNSRRELAVRETDAGDGGQPEAAGAPRPQERASEAEVVRFVTDKLAGKGAPKVSLQADLYGDLKLSGDDVEELFLGFAEKFGLSLEGLDVSGCFHGEGWIGIFPPGFFFKPTRRIRVHHLVSAARTGSWPIFEDV